MQSEQKNGKKFAIGIVSSIIVASILIVIVITAFYKLYDPEKYGKCNGGINQCEEPKVTQPKVD